MTIIGLISLSYNAIQYNIIDNKLSCLKPVGTGPHR
jgi:hypothetical protein